MATLEQQTLSNLLKSQSQGGAAVAGGRLGAGADVPGVLSANPATRQLLQDSVKISSGRGSVAPATQNPARDIRSGIRAQTDANLAAQRARGEVSQTQQNVSPVQQPSDTLRSNEPETTAASIRQEAQDLLQAQINQIRSDFDPRFRAATAAGERRTGQTRGLNAAAGTTFGSFGAQQLGETATANEAQVDALNQELLATIANASAVSRGEASQRVENFEERAALAADRAQTQRLAEQRLAVQNQQFEAQQEFNRQLALGQIDGQSTVEGQRLAQGASEFDQSLGLQRDELALRVQTAEQQGLITQEQDDGSIVAYNPLTGTSEVIIGVDESLALRRSQEAAASAARSTPTETPVSIADMLIFNEVETLRNEIDPETGLRTNPNIVSSLDQSERAAYTRGATEAQRQATEDALAQGSSQGTQLGFGGSSLPPISNSLLTLDPITGTAPQSTASRQNTGDSLFSVSGGR